MCPPPITGCRMARERCNSGNCLPKTTGPHAVAMIIHGGCWVDRLPGMDPRSTSFEPLRPLAAALTSAGIATWNVEYRRAGTPGGGWPGSFDDLARATDFLRTIAPKCDLDLKRVAAVGHSAGGQLALWVAARPKLPPWSAVYTGSALAVQAAVDIDGPPDLATAEPEEGKALLRSRDHAIPGRHTRRPARALSRGLSACVGPARPPANDRGGQPPGKRTNLVSSYQAGAATKGDNVTVVTLDGSGHFDMLQPGTKYSGKVQEQILSALKSGSRRIDPVPVIRARARRAAS